jgi:hypothetical protein
VREKEGRGVFLEGDVGFRGNLCFGEYICLRFYAVFLFHRS